eukprot:3760154-Pyramimonas_sp.AAC.1
MSSPRAMLPRVGPQGHHRSIQLGGCRRKTGSGALVVSLRDVAISVATSARRVVGPPGRRRVAMAGPASTAAE